MNSDKKLKDFVKKLLNNSLNELEIKSSMDELGVEYTDNPTKRWQIILEKLDARPEEAEL